MFGVECPLFDIQETHHLKVLVIVLVVVLVMDFSSTPKRVASISLGLVVCDLPQENVKKNQTFSRGARRARGECLSSVSRSEEHTSELQSRVDLVCRLLLEKKKKRKETQTIVA